MEKDKALIMILIAGVFVGLVTVISITDKVF